MESWRATLAAGNPDAAWNEFIGSYRRLIFAVIRRTIPDADDADEVFAEICEKLSSNNLARLTQHNDTGSARFSTWLVTVVHRLTIDWLRHRDGRRRVATPAALTEIQQFVFDKVVRQGCSYAEAYEIARQHLALAIPFTGFMKEVRGMFSVLDKQRGGAAHYFPGPPEPLEQQQGSAHDMIALADAAAKVNAALDALPADEQIAVRLFVVDEMPAAEVAKIVGWPNPKTVYNRVYRALETLRRDLGDLKDE